MNFPDLHRHLGGATHPRILWGYIEKHPGDQSADLRARFPTYADFAREFSRPFADLADYLTVHHLVEALQAEDVPYFTLRAVRGAAVFESIDYLEIRFNPYKRTPPSLPRAERLALMAEVARQVIAAARTEFPIATAFILCMDRGFPPDLNRAILDLAATLPETAAVDLAGPYQPGGPTPEEWRDLYAEAKGRGLRTTAHMAESDPDDEIDETTTKFKTRDPDRARASPSAAGIGGAGDLPGGLPDHVSAHEHAARALRSAPGLRAVRGGGRSRLHRHGQPGPARGRRAHRRAVRTARPRERHPLQ